MKLTKMIVTPNKVLIGFMVEGKASEFGEVGNEKRERAMQIAHLMNNNFNNSQVLFKNGTITEKGKFHINQLGMVCMTNEGPKEVDNTITLTERYVRENENIGFGVKFGDGTSNKYKYSDIIKLSELFKPVNFIVKVTEAGKQYIAGKTGSPLSSLPVIPIEDAGSAKKIKSGAKPITPVTGGNLVNTIDIMDIFDFVDNANGFIINFHDTKYSATSDKVESVPSQFKSLNVGEVGSPRLDFNETKFNATCKFKNPGVIDLNEIGAESSKPETPAPMFIGASAARNIYTFVYRSKNLFYNGEHHLSRIGIIIPANLEHELFDKFGKSLAITEVTDNNVISVVNRLINWKDSKIFEVDTSKLALISPEKYSKFILNNKEIYDATYKLALAKIGMKYVRGELKNLATLGIVAPPKNKSIAPQFAMKSESELKELIEAGIDVFSGAFIEKGTERKNTSKSGSADSVIEISYIIDGMDPKNFSYDKIVSNTDRNPAEINALVAKVSSVEEPIRKVNLLNELADELEKREYEAKNKLWKHKTSMWLQSNKTGVHKHNSKCWSLNDKKRTKATCYNCTDPKAAGLQILLLNTNITK